MPKQKKAFGADSNVRGNDIGSNGPCSDIDSREPGSNTGSTLHGNNKWRRPSAAALREWGFQVRGGDLVRIPVKFTMSGVRHGMSGAVISD